MDGDIEHVYPVGDLVEHELSEDCVCGPRVEPVFDDHGSCSWIVVHQALDGRE